ncbi:hypothetical protein M407DRAFT_34419 [Tulasnella calospora MUT 4182]|uniref:Uncharacterized protein n=1 Tax=Tulasnella calospora MUT 4182 TaxID=1051891 RepID=A0A0C3Q1B5_9AGAM|nr:hypothetical protein M407DRAFT_34419 [Tulasnella calospora MUT 4182]
MSFETAPAVSRARQLARIVQEEIAGSWRAWQKLPRPLRVAVYGALFGIAFYPILGFCGAGVVVKGSIAAAIQSSIGNVSAGSAFSVMQYLGAKGIMMWLLPSVCAVSAVVLVELIAWLHGLMRRLREWLWPSLYAKIRTGMAELIKSIHNLIRLKQKQARPYKPIPWPQGDDTPTCMPHPTISSTAPTAELRFGHTKYASDSTLS